MRIFIHNVFHRWMKKEGFRGSELLNAVREIENGLYEANLGSGLYKKRVAKVGAGKRGSYRTLLAFKQEHRIIFLYGFAKSERENMNSKEKYVYKKLAKLFIEIPEAKINLLMKNGELAEIHDEKTKKR